MKRQSERESSPGGRSSSSSAKRPREREREAEAGGRRAAHKASGGAKHPAPARVRDKPRGSGGGGGGGGGGGHRDGRGAGDANHRAGGGRSGAGGGGGRAGKASGDAGGSPRASPLPPPPPPGPEPPAAAAAAPEYKTLLISSLSPALPAEHLEDRLFHQFKRFGDISLRLSHTPELGRVAYVNFRHPQDARDARQHALARQLLLYDRPLKVEPVYLRGGRRGAAASTPPPGPPAPADALGYLPLHGGGGGYAYKQRSLSPVAAPPRARHAAAAFALDAAAAAASALPRERAAAALDYYALYDERGRPYAYPGAAAAAAAADEHELMPEDDQRATRNLFIGNLDHGVSEAELRRAFEKYGIIEEVVIKRPARGQGGAYAFLKFQNLDMAHRAKVAMSGRVVGRNPIKIGYGKANPSTRLWVGGLGPNTSLAALAREFDRFGSIRAIDHVKGDSFAYIQYESLDAAQAACAKMRGFPLGGPERRLRVDFAKAEDAARYPPAYPPPPPPAHYELPADGYARHRGPDAELRARDRTPPHLLYAERERAFADADWPGAAKGAERRPGPDGYGRAARSRSGERWAADAERGPPKPWDERRKRRSLSSERGRASRSPYEERGRTKGGAAPAERADRTPERGGGARRENHADGAKDALSNSRHGPDERGHHHHHHHHHDAADAKRAREAERNHRTAAEPEPKAPDGPRHEPRRPKTLAEFAQTLPLGWHGLLVLKNSCFPTAMHVLEGDPAVPGALLRDHASGGRLAQLKIAQRLRLDQPKLDEVTRRIRQGSPDGYAVLLATQAAPAPAPAAEPGLQRRLLRNLVSYLKQKQAAGVISLPVGGCKGRDGAGPGSGMLYAFPPCDFSQQYLQAAPRTPGRLEEEYMVVVIVRDAA